MHLTFTVNKCYQRAWRHEIFTDGKRLMQAKPSTCWCSAKSTWPSLQRDAGQAGHWQDLTRGKAKGGRSKTQAGHRECGLVAILYREHIFGERSLDGFIPLDTLIASVPHAAPQQAKKEPELGNRLRWLDGWLKMQAGGLEDALRERLPVPVRRDGRR